MASNTRPALQDAKFWTWTCQMQIQRVADGFTALERASDSESLHARFCADVHFLLVAGNHLRKALERGDARSARSLLSSDTCLALEQLRPSRNHHAHEVLTTKRKSIGRGPFDATRSVD